MTARRQAQGSTKPEGSSPDRNPFKEEIKSEGIEEMERFPHLKKSSQETKCLSSPRNTKRRFIQLHVCLAVSPRSLGFANLAPTLVLPEDPGGTSGIRLRGG